MTVTKRLTSLTMCIALLVAALPADAFGAGRLAADPGGLATAPPAAPTGLTAAAGDASVTLSWNDPGDPSITQYEYQMRAAPPAEGWGGPIVVPGSGAGTTGFTVDGLVNGTEYRFKVVAVNANGAGPWAPVSAPWYVAATPEQQVSIPTPSPPAAPTGLTATAGDGSVALSWDDPADSGITHYEYRMRSWPGEGWGGRIVVPGSGPGTRSFAVEGLTNGTEYRFKLYAVSVHGASAPAPVHDPWYVAATPEAAPVGVDYDGDDDGHIEITTLAQLDAVRHDLDGDGAASAGNEAAYAAAFPDAAEGMGCPESGCTGYELRANLDFDTNGNGVADAGDRYWNDGNGWPPITGYNADFDGNNDTDPEGDGGPYSISNIYSGPVFEVSGQSPLSVFGGLGANANVYNLSEDGAHIASDNDSDDDGLIDVTTLTQLIAIQWDLNGDGTPESEATKYNNAFTNGVSGCPVSGCVGYELMNDLTITLNPTDAGANHIIPGILNTTFDGNDNDITNQDARPLFQTIGQATGSTDAEVKNLKLKNTRGTKTGILANKIETTARSPRWAWRARWATRCRWRIRRPDTWAAWSTSCPAGASSTPTRRWTWRSSSRTRPGSTAPTCLSADWSGTPGPGRRFWRPTRWEASRRRPRPG